MRDERISLLAKNLINYSVALKPGEKVLIEMFGDENDLAKELVREAYLAGGVPFVSKKDNELLKVLLSDAKYDQLKATASFEVARMKEMQAYIGVRASNNISELSLLPEDKLKLYTEAYVKPLHLEQRVKHTRWCILRYPNPSMAQLADMPTEEFEDFFFKVCNLDYDKMSKAMDPLAELMERTDRVRLVANGTDISFSIKGFPAIKCDGKLNIPDGEVFTAPIRDSVNGVITYNTPSQYHGTTFENIRFEFKNGKIVKATSSNTEKINGILDIDEGARFIGEFAIGVNPFINKPMKDTLFDEKINGSIHFTPGNCYDECDNGNKSSIHWDLVLIQRPEYGGGEIWFDDKLVRKDGVFVIDSLRPLNADSLK